MAVPVSTLRARGVHTVYYQLEPISTQRCEVNALTRRAGTDQYDEVWDYSPTQVQICRDRHSRGDDGPVFRYVPLVALPDRVEAQQQPSGETETLLFLGTLAHRVACNHPPFPLGRVQRPLRRVGSTALFRGNSMRTRPVPCSHHCKHKLEAWAKEGWLQVEGSSWSDARMAAVLRSHGTFVNVHKGCNESSNPVAPRVPMLLSARALVISERCHALDEREYEGMVSFVPFEDIPREFAAMRALSRVERAALVAARAARFAARFAPRRVYEEAGVHALLHTLALQG